MTAHGACRCKQGYTVAKREGRWWCTYCRLPRPEPAATLPPVPVSPPATTTGPLA